MSKKILITGKDSYIGKSFIRYCQREGFDFHIDEIDLRDDSWRALTLSNYDIVIHVAGIAHQKETKENKHIYYEVNRDLAVEIAKKVKADGIKQFIFMSTMSVYGINEGYITKDTPLNPTNAYGDSKLQAEQLIEELEDNDFEVAVIRPPMIYGPNSKGNYNFLSNFAKKSLIFPKLDNKRSMLFIDNLSEFFAQLIMNFSSGIYCPQNKEYVSTKNMVLEIAKLHNKKINLVSIFNPALNNMKIPIIKKVFGDLTYDKQLSVFDFEYDKVDFKKSLKITES